MPIRRKVTKKKATKKRAVRKVAKKRAVRKVARKRAVRKVAKRRAYGGLEPWEPDPRAPGQTSKWGRPIPTKTEYKTALKAVLRSSYFVEVWAPAWRRKHSGRGFRRYTLEELAEKVIENARYSGWSIGYIAENPEEAAQEYNFWANHDHEDEDDHPYSGRDY